MKLPTSKTQPTDSEPVYLRVDGDKLHVTISEYSKVTEILLRGGQFRKSFMDDLRQCQEICDLLGLEFKQMIGDHPWKVVIVHGRIENLPKKT